MTPGEQTRDYYREQGRKEEQERIVKLLEVESICEDDCDHYDCVFGAFVVAIDLIKGENQVSNYDFDKGATKKREFERERIVKLLAGCSSSHKPEERCGLCERERELLAVMKGQA